MKSPQAQERPVNTTEESVAAAEWFVDPINRFIRYPVCRILVKPLLKTALTPNQVTLIHTLIAFVSGYFVSLGTYYGLITAAILFEIRNILDCLDGVLAREKKMYSLYGASIDALGDSLGFIALLVGGYIYLIKTETYGFSFLITILVLFASAFMAASFVFQKKRFYEPMTEGRNGVEVELFELKYELDNNKKFFATRLVYMFAFLPIVTMSPFGFRRIRKSLKENAGIDNRQAEFLVKNASSPVLKILLMFLSIATGESLITILQIGMLTNNFLAAYKFILVYAAVCWVLVVIFTNLFLSRAHKEN
jgi:phosphatidylglycerophosphate synthase